MVNVINTVLAFIFAFLLLSNTYSPLEDSAISARDALNTTVLNENLGAPNNTGGVSATLTQVPLTSITAVTCNGTLITSGNYTINGNTGAFLMGHNTTAPACNASAIMEVDYERYRSAGTTSELPGVTLLLLVLVTIFGLIVLGVRRSGL